MLVTVAACRAFAGSTAKLQVVVLLQVNKLKGQEYQLLWREQPDFVRMAAKLNALIIPFGAVGGESQFCSFRFEVNYGSTLSACNHSCNILFKAAVADGECGANHSFLCWCSASVKPRLPDRPQYHVFLQGSSRIALTVTTMHACCSVVSTCACL